MKDRYESPLSGRYASEYLLKLFSEQHKIELWRKLWLSLARAEKALGLPVTDEQIEELVAHVSDINFEEAEAREKVVRHDVMAHVYAYGLQCPKAAGIIHLGATSQYVKDNADLILYREALQYLRKEVLKVV
ncbi:MAG: adenylosuccinate lyase, partial [Lachnospiraceae bacterium]|nr:adenylosuccinate lyase [Lachnospiraceae bacterium]